jgi:hypothetical protein
MPCPWKDPSGGEGDNFTQFLVKKKKEVKENFLQYSALPFDVVFWFFGLPFYFYLVEGKGSKYTKTILCVNKCRQ